MSDPFITAAIKHISVTLGCAAESINADDTIETLEKWDSPNHMRLILHLEEEIGHMIETEDILLLFSITGIANYLKKTNQPL